MRTLAQIALLAACGSALGLGVNAASPHPIALGRAVFPSSSSGTAVCSAHGPAAKHRLMPLGDATAACAACSAAFVDARGAQAYAEGHVPGAVHLPPHGDADEPAAIATLRGHDTVVVYDSGEGCGFAEGVADRLSALGFEDVRILDGSWQTWAEAGGPAQSGACEACSGHESESR